MTRLILVLFLVFAVSMETLAQPVNEEIESAETMTGPRKQMATIIMSGLAGAVLGLSTLSFYGRPQEHLNNIAMGFAVGVIGGTVFTAYQAATAPTEFMNSLNSPFKRPLKSPPMLAVTFEF